VRDGDVDAPQVTHVGGKVVPTLLGWFDEVRLVAAYVGGRLQRVTSAKSPRVISPYQI